MALEFAEIVADLVQPVGLGGELERGEDGGMNLFGSPTADGVATVQENLQQADDSRLVDFDSGIADRTDSDGQGKPLQ